MTDFDSEMTKLFIDLFMTPRDIGKLNEIRQRINVMEYMMSAASMPDEYRAHYTGLIMDWKNYLTERERTISGLNDRFSRN